MKLKKETDSIRHLALDYLCLLHMDTNGKLNDDFSLKEDFLCVVTDSVRAALEKEHEREVQILIYILSKRIELNNETSK